ncbi:hypothetical protein INH39_33020 [Massilia violaceinigra]|uniref:Growth inhibitor PemK n=1 Tax=Massilia violaceinigra TaxID=2045208 RepID=A0ABY4A6S6_9BURK|nr:hypothetical protein [Massilia violaceinigra]UOD30112.1 hypothetical protein INH39_33020 [Massilia violaceinigra]
MNARVPFGAGLFFAPTGKRHHVAVQVPLIRDGQARQYLAIGVGAGNRQPLLMNSQLPAAWVGVRTAGYFTRSGTSGRTVVLNAPLDERRRPAVNAAIFLAAIDAARREQPAVP